RALNVDDPILAGDPKLRTEPAEQVEADRAWLESWRQELMDRAWQALGTEEQSNGKPYHTVLRLKTKQPAWSAIELAEELSRVLGKPITETNARQLVFKARERFSDLLL